MDSAWLIRFRAQAYVEPPYCLSGSRGRSRIARAKRPPELLPIPRREFLLDVLSPIQHAHDLGGVIDDSIEDHMRSGGKRTEARAHLVSGAPCEGMVFDQRNHFGDFAKHLFGGMPASDPGVVIPNPLAIVERLGRPERRAPGFGHLPALMPDEIGNARHSSLSRIERAD